MPTWDDSRSESVDDGENGESLLSLHLSSSLHLLKHPGTHKGMSWLRLRLRLRLIYLGRIAVKVKYITYLGCAPAREGREQDWKTGKFSGATGRLSCSATLSKQFPRFHSNYTANAVFQGQDQHAFFIITNKPGTCAGASDGTDSRDWKSTCWYREESRNNSIPKSRPLEPCRS